MRTDNLPAGKLGPMQLVPGVTAINGWAFLLTMFFVGVLAPFINFAQPYILTEHLGIPINEQGAVSGDLAFWSEVVMILLAGVMGAWSDTMGRRLVFAFGLAGVALQVVELTRGIGSLLGQCILLHSPGAGTAVIVAA